ncbi:MAG: glycosyl hydrolase 108 family protein [Pseudomonadota bacterium]
MAKDLFQTALSHVLRFEGGFSNHPEDPGGRTQKGITQKTFDNWRKDLGQETADVKNISDEEVREIYRVNYWNAIRAESLPQSLAVVMLDAAVNSGPGNAVKALQKALKGIGIPVSIDGKIGPETLNAAKNAPEEKLLDEFIVQRGRFYGLLETFRTFGLGWARRLVAGARLGHAVLKDNLGSAPDFVEPSPDDRTPPQTEPSGSISPPVGLKRYFFDDLGVQTYGSFFELWGGWATAEHVLTAMQNRTPPFANGSIVSGVGTIDAALIGCTFPDIAPPAPREGSRLIAMGFPAGASQPSIRRCVVYMKRPSSPAWIARITAPSEPVVVGMSGGIVFDEHTRETVGIIVHRNSPADLDGDSTPDQSLDFVSLHDVHNVLKPDHLEARIA